MDDDTWERGRGWALSIALIILPYYKHTNPVFVSLLFPFGDYTFIKIEIIGVQEQVQVQLINSVHS